MNFEPNQLHPDSSARTQNWSKFLTLKHAKRHRVVLKEIAEHEIYQPSTSKSKPKPKEAVNFKLKYEIPDSLELLDQLI